jgi:hypothetical protein
LIVILTLQGSRQNGATAIGRLARADQPNTIMDAPFWCNKEQKDKNGAKVNGRALSGSTPADCRL